MDSSHLLFGSLLLILIMGVVFVSVLALTPNPVKKCSGCVIDIQSGVKTCPTSGNDLVYDTAIQECVGNTCPFYYILSDGSTSNQCPDGESCGCSSSQRCPRWVASAINTDSENYNQISLYDQDQSESTIILPDGYSCTGPENYMFPTKVCRRGVPAKLSSGEYACVTGFPMTCNQDLFFDETSGELTCPEYFD